MYSVRVACTLTVRQAKLTRQGTGVWRQAMTRTRSSYSGRRYTGRGPRVRRLTGKPTTTAATTTSSAVAVSGRCDTHRGLQTLTLRTRFLHPRQGRASINIAILCSYAIKYNIRSLFIYTGVHRCIPDVIYVN